MYITYAKEQKHWIWWHTCDSFNIGDIEISTAGKCSEECSHICSTLEAFSWLLVTLTVVNLQVHNGPVSKNGQKDWYCTLFYNPNNFVDLKCYCHADVLPFNLHRIQLSAFPRAGHGGHTLLHLTQNIGRHWSPLGPAICRAFQHIMFNQILFVAIVRKDHGLSFGITTEHHIGVKNAAEISEKRWRMVFKQLGGNMDHQYQMSISKLLWHVVGTIQAIPFTLRIVATLVAVTVGIVVFAILII